MNAQEVRNLCRVILEEGKQRYGMILGIVSHISEGSYEVFAVSSETGIPQAGDLFNLDAVYCREVFQKRETVAISEIDGHRGMCLHPLYTYIPCEAYISSPIVIDGETWGTLNFTTLELRDEPFSAEDVAFNETQAKRIAAAVTEARL